MTSKKDLRDDIDQLSEESDDNGVCFAYEHPADGKDGLYNKYKERIDPDDYGLVVKYTGADCPPFVVEREKAEAEGLPVVREVTDEEQTPKRDLVEVSEWCVNGWVDNADDREYYSE